MATVLTAADLDKALLAALRAAVPEQLGDDLVLRLPDGRIFFIDGFFAADEIGDGLAPVPEAVELAREIADLLLGAPEIETAAGGEAPEAPPSSGVGFEPLARTEQPNAEEPDSRADEEEIEDARSVAREIDRTQRPEDSGASSFASGGSGVSLNLRAIGTISLVAGGADAPTWANSMDLRALARIEDLADPAANGWFPGLTRLFAMDAPLDFATFASRYNAAAAPEDLPDLYKLYLDKHAEWSDLAGTRTIWANLTPGEGPFSDRDNSIASNLPGGTTPEGLFSGDDLIVGTNAGWDRLNGFDGNDILIGYQGNNHLIGGNGDDVLISAQSGIFEGGVGDDTLIFVIDDETFPRRLADFGTVSGIERLVVSPQDLLNPDYLNDDFGNGRIVKANLVLELDAASIRAWGGNLVIDGIAADIRLADVENWERLAFDPADADYVRYRTIFAGEVVTLALRAGADQPIADHVTGTSEDDIFFLGGRLFQQIDGGAGNDQILGGLRGGPIGDLDLVDPATAPFRNIENIVLSAPSDSVTLSAASVAAMTDGRNTLWLTSPGFGVSNWPVEGLRVDMGGIGHVAFADAAAWTALGYMSVETARASNTETRLGAVYGAVVNGETVYLFVQVGMQQPIAGNTAGADYWFVDHAGWVSLPRADVVLDLSLVDLDNSLANQITLSVAAVDHIAGADGIVTLDGDAGLDAVHFLDMPNWQFGGMLGGYAIYQGADSDGHQATLRIAADLVQPTLLPDPDTGDLDTIDLTNGQPDQLAFDVASAAHYAGANKFLEIFGDGSDQLSFVNPADWHLAGRDGNFFIYEGDDGTIQASLRLHADVDRPLFIPVFTDGDDDVTLADLMVVDQYSDLDGKGGFDTLHLMDADLTSLSLDFIKHIEAIDLTNSVKSSFTIAASTLVANDIAGPLYITGESKDSVMLDPGSVIDGLHDWEILGTVTNAAVSNNPFTLYQVTIHYQSGDVTAQMAVDQALIQPALPA